MKMKNLMIIGLLFLIFFAGQAAFAQETSKTEPTIEQTVEFLKGKIDGTRAVAKGSYKGVVLNVYNFSYTYEVKNATNSRLKLEENYSLEQDRPNSGRSTKTCSSNVTIYFGEIVPSSIKIREWENNFVISMKRLEDGKEEPILVVDNCEETGFGDNNNFFGQKNAGSFGIIISNKETAEKVAKALAHAAKLNGGKEELF